MRYCPIFGPQIFHKLDLAEAFEAHVALLAAWNQLSPGYFDFELSLYGDSKLRRIVCVFIGVGYDNNYEMLGNWVKLAQAGSCISRANPSS